MTTYKITRMYKGDKASETIATGLSLAEAQQHCKNPETSSSTAKLPQQVERTRKFGPWFDGYDEEK